MVGYNYQTLEWNEYNPASIAGAKCRTRLDKCLWPVGVRGTEHNSELLASAHVARV